MPQKRVKDDDEVYVFSHHGQIIYLTGETKPFRQLAREIPALDNGQGIIEIGSSYGECLNILSKRSNGQAIGFEISKECIEHSIKKYPRLDGNIKLCDVLSDDGANLMEEFASQSYTAFVDIGGDRHAEAVIQLCKKSLTHPKQIVIKCRLLFRSARKYLKDSTGEHDVFLKKLMEVPSVTITNQNVDEEEACSSIVDKSSSIINTTNAEDDFSKYDIKERSLIIDHFLSNWWLGLIDNINSNGLNSGSAGIGTPRWARQNQQHVNVPIKQDVD